MVNGPMGGNMGTPPVEPQPPQVSFTTTAESRGGFNNFLKSIPATTSMTPIPSLGSSPMMPAPNPMNNIDIFNQPPSMGMGMMGMNQPPMNPMMQQPMQPPMNMGVGLMGTPVQNFYNGGGVDDFSDFGGFSDSSDPFGGGDSFNDSNDTSDPSIGSDSSFNEQNFQDALDNLNTGSDAPSDDQAFADDPAIVDRRGINVGLENTGKFTTGVVPNLRGERFARFETPAYAQRALGRDFQTKIGNNPNLTAGNYFETFTPTSENPGGTGNRMAEFTSATGKGSNDILSLNDMNNIMDIQGKYEAGIRNNPTGQIEKISTTVPMNDDKQIANILDNLDLSKDLALDKPDIDVFENIVPDPAVAQRNFQTGLPGANLPNVGSTRSTVAEDQAKALANLVGGSPPLTDVEKGVQQNQEDLMAQRGRALGPTTFRDDAADVTFENIRGQTPTTDTVFDIDTNVVDRNPDLDALRSQGRNFVGNDAFDDSTFITSRDSQIDTTNPNEMRSQSNVARTMSPGESRSRYGSDIGTQVSGLEDQFQSELNNLSQKRDFNIPGFAGGILNAIGNNSRSRMFDALSTNQGSRLFGGDFKPTPIYQDGQIVGVKDQFGNLMEGRDPNAPMNIGDDNDSNPLILRPIAKPIEEEDDGDKPPNVIGGGETPAPVSSGSVVVDSPFTSNVGNFIPSSFNTGELNKLIEALTGVSAPRAMKQGGVAGYAEGGRVMQALDNLLATG